VFNLCNKVVWPLSTRFCFEKWTFIELNYWTYKFFTDLRKKWRHVYEIPPTLYRTYVDKEGCLRRCKAFKLDLTDVISGMPKRQKLHFSSNIVQ
jgi:hypothetical protein